MVDGVLVVRLAGKLAMASLGDLSQRKYLLLC